MDQSIALIVGIILALISTIMFNIPPILQKQALDSMKEVSMTNIGESVKSMFKNKRWVIGFILGVLGGLPYTLSLNYAGVTVVQPIINFGLLILVWFSHRMLKEELKLTAKLAIAGMISVPFFISFSQVTPPQADMSTSVVRITFFVALALLFILVFVCMLIGKKKPIFWAFASGITFATGATSIQATVSSITFLGYDLVQDFEFLILNIFNIPGFHWVLIFAAISILLNVLATYFLQIALQKSEASKAGPINQTLNNIFTVIIGLVVFQQAVGNVILYTIGFLIALFSAFVLAQFQIPQAEKTPQ